jgi:hypothetical protein
MDVGIGRIGGVWSGRIFGRIEQSAACRHTHSGYVLPPTYQVSMRARGSCVHSLDEGFGMPVLKPWRQEFSDCGQSRSLTGGMRRLP